MVLALCAVIVLGCDNRAPITQYTVPRDAAKTSSPVVERDDRMVVGLALFEGTAWFFKLVGDQDQVDAMSDTYLDFLKSIRFSDDGLGIPKWDAPSDWQRMPGTGLRYATYVTANGLDVAISKLAYSGELEGYLRANVDRWRREMDLPPVPPSTEIMTELEELPMESGRLFVLRLDGAYSGGAMAGRGGPVAGAPTTAPGSGESPEPSGSGATRSTIAEFATPAGWTAGDATAISSVSLTYSDDAGSAKITATGLAAAANRWGDNALRWAAQVGTQLTPDQVEAATQAIQVDGRSAQLIELPSGAFSEDAAELSGEGLIGVMVVDGQTAWFLKLSGDVKTVVGQRNAFRAFLDSIKFGQE